MRIVYFGTPEFAVPMLETLVKAGKNVVGVVTVADKPSGRGLQMQASPVKQTAEKLGLPVLQPVSLNAADFQEAYHRLQPDLNVIVAFRMLPESIWNYPPMGSVNLHASLLPKYRGAAPINFAIINGEYETGLTTFFLQHEIDTGSIIQQLRMPIGVDETAGSLYQRMMQLGGPFLLETLELIAAGKAQATPQNLQGNWPRAPKITKEIQRIDFSTKAENVHNLVRGLSPYPGATAMLKMGEASAQIKIIKGTLPELREEISLKPGQTALLHRQRLWVGCVDRPYEILELQFPGKKALPSADFLRGFCWEPGFFLA